MNNLLWNYCEKKLWLMIIKNVGNNLAPVQGKCVTIKRT